jgi:hypothetical protein
VKWFYVMRGFDGSVRFPLSSSVMACYEFYRFLDKQFMHPDCLFLILLSVHITRTSISISI